MDGRRYEVSKKDVIMSLTPLKAIPEKIYPTVKDDGKASVGLVALAASYPFAVSILCSSLLFISLVAS